MTNAEYRLGKMGKSRIDLAAFLGKTEQTIKNYFAKVYQPPFDIAMKMAEFTGIEDIATILLEVDENGKIIEEPTAANA